MKRTILRKSLKRFAVGVLAAAALTFGLPASPAFAINTVACAGRTDFLKLEIWLGYMWTDRCFANAGPMAVDIGGVYKVTSGNNKVTVNYQSGPGYYSRTFGPWEATNLGGARVYEVRIW
ncbi:beta/gamma crystallin domain-containing protein [Micromonospora sp. NPDC023814]|uniref:beta/gamma crystallin domain-containing protein n=1 Tax=Micromonospora sp. NPDC023814 TaxID=3154596 RepID=UPI00340097D0